MLTVTVPAENQNLTSVATAKDELRITDRTYDVRLARWIREASATIADYTRRVYAQETVTETFLSDPVSYWRPAMATGWPHGICLARYPVSAIASVTVDGTLLDPTEYRIDSATGLLYRLAADDAMIEDWSGYQTDVVYTGGFVLLDGLPPPVEEACLQLLRHRYASVRRDPALRTKNIPGVQEETYWVGGIGDDGAMPPEVAGLLQPYIDMRS